MGKITLVTGGARSGKSSFAQKLAQQYDDVAYIATAIITDEEMHRRVEAHKSSRQQSWTTYETPYDMKNVFRGYSHDMYLVDCITVYITNFLYNYGCFEDNVAGVRVCEAEETLKRHIDDILSEITELGRNVIFVTNEVGLGIVPETFQGRIFRDIAGRINQIAAERADNVWLVCCGQPLKIKG